MTPSHECGLGRGCILLIERCMVSLHGFVVGFCKGQNFAKREYLEAAGSGRMPA
jgi:hypothetical protein